MFVVVVVVVAFVAVSFLGCSRWLIGFESVSGAQLVLPSGRTGAKSTALRAVANGKQRRVAGICLN